MAAPGGNLVRRGHRAVRQQRSLRAVRHHQRHDMGIRGSGADVPAEMKIRCQQYMTYLTGVANSILRLTANSPLQTGHQAGIPGSPSLFRRPPPDLLRRQSPSQRNISIIHAAVCRLFRKTIPRRYPTSALVPIGPSHDPDCVLQHSLGTLWPPKKGPGICRGPGRRVELASAGHIV